MDISKIKLFNLMQSNLNFLSTRQTVLSQNIANSNTPGYQAKDLKKIDFASTLQTTITAHLSTTNENHIHGTKSASTGRIVSADAFEISPTGNKVVLEDEVMKMSHNSMEYQETTNLYRKMMDMIKTAIGNV